MIFRRKKFDGPTASTEEERAEVEAVRNARRFLEWRLEQAARAIKAWLAL